MVVTKFEFLEYLPAPVAEQARKELELLQQAGIPTEEIAKALWKKYKPTPVRTTTTALKSKTIVELQGFILYTTHYSWGIVARFADATGGVNIVVHRDSEVKVPENLPAKVKVIGKAKHNRRGEIVVFPTSILPHEH